MHSYSRRLSQTLGYCVNSSQNYKLSVDSYPKLPSVFQTVRQFLSLTWSNNHCLISCKAIVLSQILGHYPNFHLRPVNAQSIHIQNFPKLTWSTNYSLISCTAILLSRALEYCSNSSQNYEHSIDPNPFLFLSLSQIVLITHLIHESLFHFLHVILFI